MTAAVWSATILSGHVPGSGNIYTVAPIGDSVRLIKFISMYNTDHAEGHLCQALWVAGESQLVVAHTPELNIGIDNASNIPPIDTSWAGEVRVVLLPGEVFSFSSVAGEYDCYASGYYLRPGS